MTYELAHKDDNWIVNSINVERLVDRNDISEYTMTEKDAITIVRNNLEISQELDTIVEVDHIEDNGDFTVHVYDIVEHEDGSHTSTRGWYTVDSHDSTVEEIM
ncbi:hypothetical protein [Paenisporosarcina sp. TG20]|uniref:hypothetical protein n=1 Tax=Paenisporosarcina sp. TG20 TaxID=1211706 RepID=UPI000304E3C9|nr:hypothetical protein [Paenisporosarcina sp. TG20]